MTTINDVLGFWFADDSQPDQSNPDGRDLKDWFQPGPGFDAEIRRRFLAAWEQAATGALDHWADTAQGALALTVLLDQFPRNMFRGDARAFASDRAALAVAERAIARDFDQEVPKVWRKFFYLPFEHAEDRAAQDRAVALIGALGQEETTRYAVLHRDIIERFGRFPHRNAILGRDSTPEEQAWLDGGGETFGTKA